MIDNERVRGAAAALRCLSERLTEEEKEVLIKLETRVFKRLVKED